MTPLDQGFLLLTQQLGVPSRKPLTTAQFRELTLMARAMERPDNSLRELTLEDLMAIGCDFLTGEQILSLLSQTELLDSYLSRGAAAGCQPITRLSPVYPHAFRKKLGADSPGCLWAKGDLSLLSAPMIALVGSRELYADNYAFAREAGRQAALQGFTLVSGNARGADTEAQESCLAHGGKVVSIVADRLDACPVSRNTLWLSENGFDLPFSSQRALSRNRLIHCLPLLVLAAQVTLHQSGTWSGSIRNLKHRWTPLLCFDDSREGTKALIALGALPVTRQALGNLNALIEKSATFL